jgi:hypothetical protein
MLRSPMRARVSDWVANCGWGYLIGFCISQFGIKLSNIAILLILVAS